MTLFGIVTAYQWDLGYGNKAERINRIYHNITDPALSKYWFAPVTLPLPPWRDDVKEEEDEG